MELKSWHYQFDFTKYIEIMVKNPIPIPDHNFANQTTSDNYISPLNWPWCASNRGIAMQMNPAVVGAVVIDGVYESVTKTETYYFWWTTDINSLAPGSFEKKIDK